MEQLALKIRSTLKLELNLDEKEPLDCGVGQRELRRIFWGLLLGFLGGWWHLELQQEAAGQPRFRTTGALGTSRLEVLAVSNWRSLVDI